MYNHATASTFKRSRLNAKAQAKSERDLSIAMIAIALLLFSLTAYALIIK